MIVESLQSKSYKPKVYKLVYSFCRDEIKLKFLLNCENFFNCIRGLQPTQKVDFAMDENLKRDDADGLNTSITRLIIAYSISVEDIAVSSRICFQQKSESDSIRFAILHYEACT